MNRSRRKTRTWADLINFLVDIDVHEAFRQLGATSGSTGKVCWQITSH